jgi:hypothetical protein
VELIINEIIFKVILDVTLLMMFVFGLCSSHIMSSTSNSAVLRNKSLMRLFGAIVFRRWAWSVKIVFLLFIINFTLHLTLVIQIYWSCIDLFIKTVFKIYGHCFLVFRRLVVLLLICLLQWGSTQVTIIVWSFQWFNWLFEMTKSE